MFGFTHPKIALALLLTLFTGAGYLAGTSAQRTQAPGSGDGADSRAGERDGR
jgi:hypothetical protein